ncbi:MAG: hypothetical protein ACLP8S_18080 [Solirubrobacteraceae bacterium]
MAIEAGDLVLGDRADMYMSTSVTRGTGLFIVTATDVTDRSRSHLRGVLQAQEAAETPLTRQLSKLTSQILVIAGVAAAILMALNLSRGDDFTVVVTAAITFTISAILDRVAGGGHDDPFPRHSDLGQANAIVKRRSAETLGCTSAVNPDKTGTLTLNQKTAVRITIPGRRPTLHGLRVGILE